jgi:hypothetical protein
MKAILTLSLGETYPAPPKTDRGTIEKPTVAAVCAKNLRRETKPADKLRDRTRFFTVPLPEQITVAESLLAVARLWR